MIGDSKPNFALDLSNDGIALWHRASDGSWKQLGNVRLDDPDMTTQVAALRDQVAGPTSGNRPRRAVVRIPRSEVLLNKVRLGVFEGEAAESHARKQIDELTPYALDEVVFDLGEKGFGNMAPVGIVARQTLVEADTFARSQGFNPIYFTTQYNEREFPREPKFQLAEEKDTVKSMRFVPWVAAAAVGLTIGFFGYSYLSRPDVTAPTAVAAVNPETPETAPVEQAAAPETDSETVEVASAQAINESEIQPTPPTDTIQLGLQDIAPNLPAVQLALAVPEVTSYPELQTKSVDRSEAIENPRVVRLMVAKSDEPALTVSSKQVKTSALQIAEARRDLPDVSVNEEIARLIQDDLNIGPLARPLEQDSIKLAALTPPDQVLRPALVNPLPPVGEASNGVSDDAVIPADRPPPPPSLVKADPGTLTPTPEGTLGPGNILIYSGPPPRAPLARPGTIAPPVDPLTGFRPRFRPEGLAPEQLQTTEITEPETVEPEIVEPETLSILDLADPTLRTIRARPRPDGLVPVEPEPVELTILDLADPTLRGSKPRNRPDGLAPVVEPPVDVVAQAIQDDAATQAVVDTIAQETAEQAVEDTIAQAIEEAAQETSILASADPALRAFEPQNRPTDLVPDAVVLREGANQETDSAAPTLLALANPALAGKRARNRPGNLRVIAPAEDLGLLAFADPSLARKKSRDRPRRLRIIEPPKPEPEPEPVVEIQPEELAVVERPNTLSSATRLAVARSPNPKRRPARLARVVKRVAAAEAKENRSTASTSGTQSNNATGRDGVSGLRRVDGGATRATARTPRSAVGSSKPAPGPTTSTVARAATEKSKFRKSRLSLVGVFGTASKRRALVRLPTGKYVKVQKGDKVSGWKISAIGESSLRINKGSRNQVLRMP